ncbi:putative BPI/LBP family protein At1g04970 isoform X2 [Gastrolobium bilobum]|uniref:putative BPI/LBP family protein At1g04970 isoform X2 n=1 Tax=Gastrolobium bilobum TaxID=150636 RepID=UPI002AAF816E|nr:putative BPI/LBP family protein At1g04970 isoform X2 [Gastrolobium bilobum]
MASTIFFLLLLLSLLLIPSSGDLQHQEEGFISVVISDKGLDFAKDFLIEKAIASIVVSQLPQIEKSVQVPLVGKAKVVLSDITIQGIQVNSSSVKTGDTSIVLVVSGATANMSFNWRYSCSSWLIPIGISDSGTATVEVEDMQVGLTVNLRNQEGTLKLILLDYGCDVGDLSIKLNGGAAWLYQVLVDAFEGNIASAVEEVISKKIKEGIATLDNLLQSLPKTISLDKTAVLNVTFVDNLVLSNSSIEIQINGLFSGTNEVLVPQVYHRGLDISDSSGGLPKMIKVSLHEDVFKSASLVYFTALLNTAEWRFLIPQLYKQYPNDDISLNISASSPPVIDVTNKDMDATLFIDITIYVLEAGEVIPIACISVDISASCAVDIVGNNLTGWLKLRKFSTYLKWSKIGKLHMHVIQSVTSTVLKTVLIPYLNSQLKRGFPLPIVNGFALENARVLYAQPWIAVCSDVSFLGEYHLRQLPTYVS